MAVTVLTTTMAWAVNYSVTTDSSSDFINVPVSNWFFDKTSKLTYYKTSSGDIELNGVSIYMPPMINSITRGYIVQANSTTIQALGLSAGTLSGSSVAVALDPSTSLDAISPAIWTRSTGAGTEVTCRYGYNGDFLCYKGGGHLIFDFNNYFGQNQQFYGGIVSNVNAAISDAYSVNDLIVSGALTGTMITTKKTSNNYWVTIGNSDFTYSEVDLGANFPCRDGSGERLRFEVFIQKGSNIAYWRITNMISGATSFGSFSIISGDEELPMTIGFKASTGASAGFSQITWGRLTFTNEF